MSDEAVPRLSVCIATYNRAAYIGATIESIVSQVTDECEIVISDNASTDDTAYVVSQYAVRFGCVRYIRQETNLGLDRNFDRAVCAARGDYCWLMSDDDVLKPGAIARVLDELRKNFSLVLVDVEARDLDLSRVMKQSWLGFSADRQYQPGELDQLFMDLDRNVTYIGNIIIKRSVWMARDRERYYGSLFVHVGVLFQAELPRPALVIATPLVCYRLDNTHSFASVSELFLLKWPALVETLAVGEVAKNKVRGGRPWKNPGWLLHLRAWGFYYLDAYRRWAPAQPESLRARWGPIAIALLPGALVNALLLMYYSLRYLGRADKTYLLRPFRQSRYYWRQLRPFRSSESAWRSFRLPARAE